MIVRPSLPFIHAVAAAGLSLGLAASGFSQALMTAPSAPNGLTKLPTDPVDPDSAAAPVDLAALPEEPGSAPPLVAALPENGADGRTSLYPGADFSRLLDGFSASLALAGFYDSNIFRASDGTGQAVGDDFILSIAPSITYANPGTSLTIKAAGGVNQTTYLSNSDLSALGGNGSIGLAYEGGKIALSSALGFAREAGSNRNYDSASVERDVLNFGLNGSYRLSTKTTLDGSYKYTWDDPEGGFGGTSSTILSGSAMWRYSPLLRVGPGLRYSHQTGDLQVDRDTFGPTLRADYKLSAKVAITSELGADFVSYDGPDGASDEFLHARIGASYRPSPVWAFDLSLSRDARADSSVAGTYRELLSTRLGLTRRIQRASLALGVTYETSERVSTTGAAVDDSSGDYLIFDSLLSMPVFRGRSNLGIFYRWRDESRIGGGDWSGHQVGVSMRTEF
jgi:hypothetical protein